MTTAAARDAAAALAAKQAAEHDLSRLALCPPWRHAAFAALMATLVASPAAPLPWRFALIVCILGAIPLIMRADRRRLGVFVNGYRRGRTRLVTFPLLAAVLLFYTAAQYLAVDRGRPVAALLLAAAAFGISYAGSVLWQRVFVRELRG